jgi:hypothetical protein
MEAKAVKRQRIPRRSTLGRMGICVACTSLAVCRYPKSVQHPVMFCEEFTSSRAKAHKKEIPLEPVAVEASDPAGGTAENFSNNYIGLCKRCDKLYACRLTKPGGGTWLCEFFEERKTTK